jgi:tRNA-dihydrouridine synthase A
MMDWTDRHCRFFHRLIAPRALLYTEMVHAHAVMRGDRARLLGFDPAEHPLALQLGGSDPVELARAARVGAELGYDEVNLNVGCPSDRVQAGRFGACLMREPALVADCIAAMRAAVAIPVTVKCRLGVDDQDEYVDLHRFVETVAATGCDTFVVHARKAWLHGLSPKQNREVPPLHHDRVYRLKREFPQLTVILNGGIATAEQARESIAQVDGVMIGRVAYHDPYRLGEFEQVLFEAGPPPSRRAILERLEPYARDSLAAGDNLNHLVRHIVGLFQGRPGARTWRRVLTDLSHRPGAGWEAVEIALAAVDHPYEETAEC